MPISGADKGDFGEGADESLDGVPTLPWIYSVEQWMYAVATVVGLFASAWTIRRYIRYWSNNFEMAARLLSYKISLTVADSLVLFLYAPTQFAWITTYWWYGGDTLCRSFKFLTTFAFHLTGNMQLIISLDRLYIMTRINRVSSHKKMDYNSCRVLLFAWSFAFFCALPQLFIFRVRPAQNGDPQCVAVWVTERAAYEEYLDADNAYSEYERAVSNEHPEYVWPNGTRKINVWVNPPRWSKEQAEYDHYRMELLELIYNYWHLSTMIVLPYVGELIVYTIILSLLKYAKRGNFFNLSQLLRLKFVSPFTDIVERVRLQGDRRKSERETRRREEAEQKKTRQKQLAPRTRPRSNSQPGSSLPKTTNGNVQFHLSSMDQIVSNEDGRLSQNSGCIRYKSDIAVEQPSLHTLILEEHGSDDSVGCNGIGVSLPSRRPSGFSPPPTSPPPSPSSTPSSRISPPPALSSSVVLSRPVSEPSSSDPFSGRKLDRPTEICLVRTHPASDDGSPPSPASTTLSPEETRDSLIEMSAASRTSLTNKAVNVDNGRSLSTIANIRRKFRRNKEVDDVEGNLCSRPWMHTVTVARRNAKKKAFYMLTLNLLFWLPYCAQAILASVIHFENYQFLQFAQALTCFNAITNIIL